MLFFLARIRGTSYTNTHLLIFSAQPIQHPQKKAAPLVGFVLHHFVACQLSRDMSVPVDGSVQEK